MSTKDKKQTDYSLQYLVRSFKSISHKPYESYVIQRIWHRLGDDRVQFVLQQYVNRGSRDKYALADLYLPQVKMVVEVNEKYHYTSEEQKERDALRNAEVAKRGKVDVHVVNCDQTLEKVHSDIEAIVDEIRSRIAKMGDKFIPWNGYILRDASYYKEKGVLNVEDDIYVNTIDEACAIFHNVHAKHKGYLRVAAADIDTETMVWTPDAGNKAWHNELLDDGTVILEYANDKEKNRRHVETESKDTNQKRVVFFRQRDDFGLNLYKFVGVFMLDVERTKKENNTYWKKVSDSYIIPKK
ncbi:MAG: hypothetical protein IJ634_05880 [Bacteroidales bacterium]|nr:hypothetical protein [Bacteroidales bacterium]